MLRVLEQKKFGNCEQKYLGTISGVATDTLDGIF